MLLSEANIKNSHLFKYFKFEQKQYYHSLIIYYFGLEIYWFYFGICLRNYTEKWGKFLIKKSIIAILKGLCNINQFGPIYTCIYTNNVHNS